MISINRNTQILSVQTTNLNFSTELNVYILGRDPLLNDLMIH